MSTIFPPLYLFPTFVNFEFPLSECRNFLLRRSTCLFSSKPMPGAQVSSAFFSFSRRWLLGLLSFSFKVDKCIHDDRIGWEKYTQS